MKNRYHTLMNDYDRIEKVIKYLEGNFQKQPTLAQLAKLTGLSESHFHRLFTRWAGTTPKSFLQYLTAKHAKQLLLESKDLLTASFDSGLSGPSRLHDLFVSIEAITPGEYKAKGTGVEIQYGIHKTPFGDCLIGITKRGICHLAFLDCDRLHSIEELKDRFPHASIKMNKAMTAKVVKKIFSKTRTSKISLVLQGTPFQLKVWEALLRIPEGSIVTYGDLADIAGASGASRAVGTALSQNSIAYLIPCHRVIRATGDFGEYRWGTARKLAVLGWENARKEVGDEG